MRALDYIKQKKEIICWNVFRLDEETNSWQLIDVAEIEEYELVDDAFIDSNFSCDLYLTNY